MSYNPNPLGRFCPTSYVLSPLLFECQATSSIGPYRASVLPARAAYSHSASVGRRPPAHAQYACASSQLTFTIGIWSLLQPGLKSGAVGIAFPVHAAKRLYAPTVTSVCPSQKPFVMVTWCGGFSLPSHSLSPGEQPISKLPSGIHTYFSPSLGLTLTSPSNSPALTHGFTSWPQCLQTRAFLRI